VGHTLHRADFYLLLGWAALDRGQLDIAQQQFERATAVAKEKEDKQSAEQGANSLYRIKTQQALNTHNIPLLQTLLNGDHGDLVLSVIEGAAWQQYKAQKYSGAHELFTLIEHQEGQYLSLWSQGRRQQAADLACQINTKVFIQRCAESFAQQQFDFYQDHQYKKSIHAAQQLQQVRPLSVDEQSLLGWAATKDGQSHIATAAFETVLHHSPDDEVIAKELIRLNENNKDVLEQLSARFDAIDRIRRASVAERTWWRKQFLLAYLSGDKRITDAQTRDSFSVIYGVTTRSRSGEQGLGNFDVLTQTIGIGDVYHNWQWHVGLDVVQFYTGEVQQNAWFADGQLSTPFNGITGFEDQNIRGELSYQAKDWNFYTHVNYGMFDQPVDTNLTGQLSASWFLPKVTLAASVIRKAKEDSMLSQTGTYNANHEQPWGYVMEDQVTLLAAYGLTHNLSLSGTLQLSRLTGEGVKDNNGFSLRTDLAYNLAERVSPILDYWRVGPFVSYTAYSHNLSGFTYGNGGYFSPDYFVSVGAYTELLTLETQRWQVKLKGALGVSRFEEQDEPRFPLSTPEELSGDSPSLGDNQTTGASGNLMAEGQYRLTKNWIVAGYVGKAFAVEYQSFEAGIQIRWRGGKGNGVLSDELLLSSPRLSGFAL
ncbi:cellulose synthase subunit BcsC-related outer membrane protein, partial [Alteromonas sp. 14N.309.X.WAT.G.H12]|uniref:cellulose synthase subunit BcsC-related outer membrane protein n=1 Tax=Alteromonas sp. 14N.309.X.WAT.G.H12 TaxID=3120824 RepID=UPI002FD0A2A7